MHACNFNTQGVEVGGLEVQGHSQIPHLVETNLSYMRYQLNNKQIWQEPGCVSPYLGALWYACIHVYVCRHIYYVGYKWPAVGY